MAKVHAYIKSGYKTDNETTIYIRLKEGRQFDLALATKYKIKPSLWNTEKREVRNKTIANDRVEINNFLASVKSSLRQRYSTDYSNGVTINKNWLKSVLNEFYGQKETTSRDQVDFNIFTNYCNYFIDNLPIKLDKKTGRQGATTNTIQKYKNTLIKVENYERYTKKKLRLLDINESFQLGYIKYLKDSELLATNTIGRSIVYIKTICNDAHKRGYEVSTELSEVKGFKEKVDFTYFNESEIEKIIAHDFSKTPYLNNARDWLVIGLHTGQRISDFMKFDDDTINEDYLEFTQQKTNALTLVPIHSNLRSILSKYDGHFPHRISDQKFNDFIKIVCKEVGFTQLIDGSKMNKVTKRKESGLFPKYELVTSHICRRSFATNHYGKLSTPVIMSITNHSTEKSFLTYIGKTQKDHAEQLHEYWKQLESDSSNMSDSPLKVFKQAK